MRTNIPNQIADKDARAMYMRLAKLMEPDALAKCSDMLAVYCGLVVKINQLEKTVDLSDYRQAVVYQMMIGGATKMANQLALVPKNSKRKATVINVELPPRQ